MQGAYKLYYENGTKELEMNYVDDVLHGEATYFSPTGEVQMIRQYRYGKFIEITWLDSNGKRKPWVPVENETIKIKTYYQNGKVSRDFNMENGLFIGQYLEYSYAGKLIAETNYLNGNEHGETKEYHSNGKLKSSKMNAHGFKEGEFVLYHPNGKVKSKGTYMNDEIVGEEERFDKYGKKLPSYIWSDGTVIEIKG